jgi:hypothetical protein
MAVATVASRISPLHPSVITSESISRYASLTTQIKSLEVTSLFKFFNVRGSRIDPLKEFSLHRN